MDILRKKIESIGGLPTLPRVASEIIARVSDPDSSMKDISKIIHQDPSLAAKILKVANSAFYGLRQEVSTLQLAMVVLGGLGSPAGVVTGAVALSMFNSWVLREVPVDLSAVSAGLYGAVLVVMTLVRPVGLVPARDRDPLS